MPTLRDLLKEGLGTILEPLVKGLLDYLWPCGNYPWWLRVLPNLLSMARVIPAALMVFVGSLLPSPANDHRAMVIMLWAVGIGAFTDTMDGILARAMDMTNGRGATFDALFDFVMIIGFHIGWLMSTFKFSQSLGAFLLTLVGMRFILQLMIASAGKAEIRTTGRPAKSGTAGKLKTALDMVVIIPLAIWGVTKYGTSAGYAIFWVTVVIMIVTLILGAQARRYHLANERRARRARLDGWLATPTPR